jgi:NAD(P)H-hydrate epimerase
LLSDVKVEILDVAHLRDALPQRPRGAHKGTFGRVLVVAGSLHYTGAPYLAAMGAYRIGAGLVTLALPRTIYPALAAKALEPTFLPLPEFVLGAIGEEAIKPLTEVLDRYQAMVMGCGLGQEAETVSFVRRFLQMRERGHSGIGFLVRDEEEFTWELPPLVLDADALNALAGVPEWWRSLPAGRVVLTPHPGEMARLLGASQEEVLSSRIAIAQRAATTWQQVVVFKGAYSVIAHPDGRVVVNSMATPALATAGTGDVLAGAVAGFLGQGASPFVAALLGVYLHGLAGEMLEQDVGPAGGIAGQILERLPLALRQLREGA